VTISRDEQATDGVYSPTAGYALAATAYEQWHWFNFWRLNEAPIVENWGRTLSPRKVLDAGSGTGVYRPFFESLGHLVVAVDLSFEMLQVQLQKSRRAAVIQGNISNLPLRSSVFDAVLCTRVLSHLNDVTSTLREYSRIAKPNARVLITDVHPQHHYSEMSIPTGRGRISICTFKHSIPEMVHTIQSEGFELIEFKELYLNELISKPPVTNFENIYKDPTRPIFYIMSLKKP
jgi:ubiquinone/menaquinone biosynthesis C-methylase UbiE